MAIKIKKKVKKNDAEDEGGSNFPSPNEDDGSVDPIDDLIQGDKFIETADASLSFAQQNRTVLIAVFVVLALVVVGIVVWMQQSEESANQQSAVLTAGVEVMEARVKSKDEPVVPPPEGKAKKEGLTFETEEAKFKALDEKSTAALDAVKNTPAQWTATLMKARSAMGLGKADEAATLYQSWLSANKSAFERPLVLQSLAAAQAQTGKVAEAEKTLEELRAIDEKAYGEFASYEIARIYDNAKKAGEAKSKYEAFVKSYPDSERVSWAKMRIDNM